MQHFRGSYGAKEIMPLWRDAAGTEANICPGFLDVLRESFGTDVTPEDLLAYVYGILGQPVYTARFHGELGTREIRVPISKDPVLGNHPKPAIHNHLKTGQR
jgi:predicted helicase